MAKTAFEIGSSVCYFLHDFVDVEKTFHHILPTREQ